MGAATVAVPQAGRFTWVLSLVTDWFQYQTSQ